MKTDRSRQFRSLLVGGLLPVVAFTWVENQFGTLWGLVAGMVLGMGEILWEWRTQRKVDPLTWGGNGLLIVLGAVSLLTQEGVWFKLQPSFIETVMALGLWSSLLWKKPFLISLAQKQGALPLDLDKGLRPGMGAVLSRAFQGLSFRLGMFFALHAALAAWAALAWSTTAWVLLKGVGLTISLMVYLVVESLVLRYRIASIQ